MTRHLALVLLARALASAAALALGFRAVSDDDFARVVLAQAWAASPKLDPTGTSWLPAPFWLSGAVLRLFGPSLDVARALAFALGLASAALVYLAARWITEGHPGPPHGALAGALVAAVFPWSARLGVATVPELPTAALTLLAIAALTTPSPDRRLWGALALLGATLSRYEPWPIAAAFAAWSLLGALRLGQGRAAQAKLVLSALIALAGPLAWIAWNHAAHGDALHFLARVAAYRQALRAGEDGSLARLFAYPWAMLREEPELCLAPLALWLIARRTPAAGALASALRPWLLPAALAAFQIGALSLALVRDGAPTHHPERATLVALLLIALLTGDLGARLAHSPAAPVLARRVGVAALALLLIGPLWIRRWFRAEHFSPRADEVAVGRVAAELVPPGAPILLEIQHYGYFAVLAAFGRPGQIVLDRSVDPRDPPTPSSFADPAALRRRLAEAGASHYIAQLTPPLSTFAGPPRATAGAWALWSVPPPPPAAQPSPFPPSPQEPPP